jgi:hypothetical protein
MCANLEPVRIARRVCFEWVRAISVCEPEPVRNAFANCSRVRIRANLEPGRNAPILCFEWVTAISTCRPEPGRNCEKRSPQPFFPSLQVSQAPLAGAACCAPTEESGVEISLRQKRKFWRFGRIAAVCFLRVARCSITGVWRFNLAQFAGRETVWGRSGRENSGEKTGALRNSG